MAILVCPVCRSMLTLTVDAQDGEEIVAGSLRCTGCPETYSIVGTIPNLLPPATRSPKES